jgi:hypothetical protein
MHEIPVEKLLMNKWYTQKQKYVNINNQYDNKYARIFIMLSCRTFRQRELGLLKHVHKNINLTK